MAEANRPSRRDLTDPLPARPERRSTHTIPRRRQEPVEDDEDDPDLRRVIRNALPPGCLARQSATSDSVA
jgi:hypothetical protein